MASLSSFITLGSFPILFYFLNGKSEVDNTKTFQDNLNNFLSVIDWIGKYLNKFGGYVCVWGGEWGCGEDRFAALRTHTTYLL